MSCFDGSIVKIDTASLQIEATATAGRNPEGVCVVNNKLYVSNSGGLDFPNYDNTVSVFDLNSFAEINRYKHKIALPAPCLYGQFKNIQSVDPVLQGLVSIGFDSVFEVLIAPPIKLSKYLIYQYQDLIFTIITFISIHRIMQMEMFPIRYLIFYRTVLLIKIL